MATAPCFPDRLAQQTAVCGALLLCRTVGRPSHTRNRGPQIPPCPRSPAMALLLSCTGPGCLAAAFATCSQQHCPPTNEVLISTNESTPANQSAKVTGTPSIGSNSGTRWHRILHRCGPESRGYFRKVPQISGKTKTLTHSYICKYLVSGVQSGLRFTKRLLLLPVTDGPPVPCWPWGTVLCPLPPERLAALLQLGLYVGIMQFLQV